MYERLYNLLLEGLSDAAKKFKAAVRGYAHYQDLDFVTRVRRKRLNHPNEFTKIKKQKGNEIDSLFPKVPTSPKRTASRAKNYYNALKNKAERYEKVIDRRVFNSKHPERN